MYVSDLCTREVIVIDCNAPVRAAAKLMQEHYIGDLVVIDHALADRRPIGVLTDRDLVIATLVDDDVDLPRLIVGDLLCRPVVTIDGTAEIPEAMRLMRIHGIRRLPVINQTGELCGLIVFDDVVEFLAEQLADLAMISTTQRRHDDRLRP